MRVESSVESEAVGLIHVRAEGGRRKRAEVRERGSHRATTDRNPTRQGTSDGVECGGTEELTREWCARARRVPTRARA